jgi:hypothetical protein
MKKTTIKTNRFTLALAAVFLLFASCDKEIDDPFSGTDNYIASFSLKQGETVLNASVTDGVITVTAPENFSLDGATATVKLSENATIVPAPADITAWDDETMFTVTSLSGKVAQYKYTVARSGIVAEGSVVLETQADVDAFGQKGVTLIEGNLIIGRTSGMDSIRTLAPLAALREVGYALIIHPTYAGEDLAGLEKLETVGGEISVARGGNNLHKIALPGLKTVSTLLISSRLVDRIDLPALTTIRQELTLQYNPLDEANFPNLKTCGKITIWGEASAQLSRASFPSLEEVGEVHISLFPQVSSIDFPELKKSGTLRFNNLDILASLNTPKLEKCTGILTLANLTITEARFPALVQAGSISITSQQIDVIDFSKLKTVDGAFTVVMAPATLRTLSLPELESVGGVFTLGTGYGDRSLETVLFPKLETIGGKLLIRGFATSAAQRNNTALTNLDGFAALQSVPSIEISYQTALTSFEGLREVFETLPSTGWKVTGNAYNPTYAALKENNAWVKP